MTKKITGYISAWLPACVWMGLIYYLSSLPGLKTASDPLLDLILRKLAHFSFYAAGFLTYFRGVNFGRHQSNYLLPFLLTVLYAISDEFHQGFVPQRQPDYRDILIDTGGAAVAALLVSRFNVLLCRFKII